MIIDFLLDHEDALDPALTVEALNRNEALLDENGPLLDVTVNQVQCVLLSGLFKTVRSRGGREIDDGKPVRLEEIREPPAAEYARLISKGRLLFEHCMTEVSHSCVIGFIDHELKKTRSSERVIVDLMGWMISERMALSALAAEEGEAAMRRCAHADYMIDHAVSLLHGLDRSAAQELAAEKEPLD